MANEVQVTFDGDPKPLDRAFDQIGASALDMSKDLDKAEGNAKGFGKALDGVADVAGNSESKFMGTADLLDGLGGAFGLPIDGAVGMARSFGDLTGGLSTLGPSIGSLGSALGGLALNPVVLGIAAVGAALVLAYKHSETFRDIVNGAFEAIKSVAGPIIETIGGAIGWLTDKLGMGGDKADDAAEEHKAAAEKMKAAYEQSSAAITGVLDAMADPFERFSHKQTLTLQQATDNLRFNVAEYKNWLEDIKVIARRYGEEVADYVVDQGPKFHGVADQLANATDKIGGQFAQQITDMQAVEAEADRYAAVMNGVFGGGGGGQSGGHGASGSWGDISTMTLPVAPTVAMPTVIIELDGVEVGRAVSSSQRSNARRGMN